MPIMMLPGTVSRPAETMVRQIDLISAGRVVSSVDGKSRACPITFIQLGFWVLQHISGDARFVLSLGNLVLEHVKKERQVLVASFSIFLCLIVSTRPYPHQRDVVLPIVARASQIRHDPLNMDDLLEEGTLDRFIDTDAVVQCQARVQSKPLEVSIWVYILPPVVAIGQ